MAKLPLLVRVELIVVIVVGTLLLLFEVGLRVVDVPGLTRAELLPPEVGTHRHAEDVRVVRTTTHETSGEPHPYLGYCLKSSWTSAPGTKPRTHNSLGFRGDETTLEKPPGTYRVVCLGGSSTYGTGPKTFAATWPARLEVLLQKAHRDLRVEVLNGGVPGWSTFESIGNLAFRMLDLDPDLVIVYHTANDSLPAVWHEPKADNSHWRAVWPIHRPSPLEPYLERSMTYLMWRKFFTREVELRSEFAYYTIQDYDPEYVVPYAEDDLPEQGFLNFERNLVTLLGIARGHDVPLIFGRQASKPEEPTDDGNLVTGRARARATQRMEEILVRVAKERGALLVDAAAALEEEATRQLAETGSQNVFVGNVHLKNSGALLLAQVFAGAIEEAGLVENR